jgi:hypothetical protein
MPRDDKNRRNGECLKALTEEIAVPIIDILFTIWNDPIPLTLVINSNKLTSPKIAATIN